MGDILTFGNRTNETARFDSPYVHSPSQQSLGRSVPEMNFTLDAVCGGVLSASCPASFDYHQFPARGLRAATTDGSVAGFGEPVAAKRV